MLTQWTREWRTVLGMRLNQRNEYDEYDSARKLWLNMTFVLPKPAAPHLRYSMLPSTAYPHIIHFSNFSSAQEQTTEFIWIYFSLVTEKSACA